MLNRSETKVVILGAGRLGGALHRALNRSGFSSTLISKPRTPLAELNAKEVLGRADVAFLCVPDAQVAAAAEAHAEVFHPGQIVAHCAGALTLEALRSVSERGIDVGSLHPLCAIASPETSFVCGSDDVRKKLSALARSAGMQPFDLVDADRARYHAAAVMASNCVMALASHAAELFQSCGLNAEKSVSALLPLMRSALSAMDQKGLPGALTGPIARGDSDVVLNHLSSLRRPTDGNVREIYAALSKRLVELSSRLGAASPESLQTVSDALDACLLECAKQNLKTGAESK